MNMIEAGARAIWDEVLRLSSSQTPQWEDKSIEAREQIRAALLELLEVSDDGT